MSNIFDNFSKELTKLCPQLKIDYKDSSVLMKALSGALFFNKTFKTDFITTIGHTVYFPSKDYIEKDPLSAAIVLAHEYTHIKESESTGQIKYSILYMMPQILLLLIIPLIFIIGWYALFCLLFLLPLPAYWRKNTEVRGYTTTLFGDHYFLKKLNYSDAEVTARLERAAERINSNTFVGPSYYFMWPFGVKKELLEAVKSVTSGDLLSKSTLHQEIKEALDSAVKNI